MRNIKIELSDLIGLQVKNFSTYLHNEIYRQKGSFRIEKVKFIELINLLGIQLRSPIENNIQIELVTKLGNWGLRGCKFFNDESCIRIEYSDSQLVSQ